MKKKIVWLIVGSIIAAILLLTSCTSPVVDEGEEAATPEEEEEVATPEEEEEAEPTLPPTTELSPAAQVIAGEISSINPTERTALANLLGVSQELNTAQSEGTISQEEGSDLGEDLGDKFSDFIRNQVDAIDPTDLGALKDFWALQKIQAQGDYETYCDPETKDYKEEQMSEKFNDYIRNWVDHIDPTDPEGLKDIFFLQKIQACAKYSELATSDTHQYKEEQMGEKFNDWVRNAVDNLDPTDPDSLGEMVFLQKLQHSKKWEEYATAETGQYKEEQLKEKFNEWVRNRVDELDPNDPNYDDELEKLRAIQRIEKYQELVTAETHEYKEERLSSTLGQYATNMVNNLAPGLPGFMQQLDELLTLQGTDTYEKFCPEEVKAYIEEQLIIKLAEGHGEIPRVVGTLPADGQSDAPITQHVLVAFDQPIDLTTVTELIETTPPVEHDVIWMAPNNVLKLLSIEPLKSGITYTYSVSIGQPVIAFEGIPVYTFSFSFTTKEPGEIPQLAGTLPFDGQTDAPVGQPIEITFDQPMAPASVEEAIVVSPAIDYTIYWQKDNTVAVIQPLSSLDFNTTYTVGIGSGATSADGITLGEGCSFHFITGIVPAPYILETTPPDGQADIPTNHPIEIAFSWPMDPDSVEAALDISPAIDYSTEWREGNFVLTIKPITTLAPYMRYKIQLDSTAMSADGIPLGLTFSLSFTARD